MKDPKTDEERSKVASDCVKALKLTLPCVIDDMKNTAQQAYAGWPDRYYVVDKDGKIAYKGEPGPKGFKTGECESALKKLIE